MCARMSYLSIQGFGTGVPSGAQSRPLGWLEVDLPLSSSAITMIVEEEAAVSSIATTDANNRTLIIVGTTNGRLVTVSSFRSRYASSVV